MISLIVWRWSPGSIAITRLMHLYIWAWGQAWLDCRGCATWGPAIIDTFFSSKMTTKLWVCMCLYRLQNGTKLSYPKISEQAQPLLSQPASAIGSLVRKPSVGLNSKKIHKQNNIPSWFYRPGANWLMIKYQFSHNFIFSNLKSTSCALMATIRLFPKLTQLLFMDKLAQLSFMDMQYIIADVGNSNCPLLFTDKCNCICADAHVRASAVPLSRLSTEGVWNQQHLLRRCDNLYLFSSRSARSVHFQLTVQFQWVALLRGYCTSYPKISMFCALSQNYQHLFEK